MSRHAVIRTRDLRTPENIPDFELYHGEILCLLGAPGSGKSRLLRSFGGFETIEGRLEVAGIRLPASDTDEWRMLRQRVGMVSWQAPPVSSISARMNVMLPALYHRKLDLAKARRATDELLDSLGFRGDAEALPAFLAPHERQLVLLARALIMEPDVLMLDEPFAADAAWHWPEISQRLADLAHEHGRALVIAGSNVAFAAAHADQVLTLGATPRHYSGWADFMDRATQEERGMIHRLGAARALTAEFHPDGQA